MNKKSKTTLTELEILKIIKILIEILEERKDEEIRILYPNTIMESDFDSNINYDYKYNKINKYIRKK